MAKVAGKLGASLSFNLGKTEETLRGVVVKNVGDPSALFE